MSTFTILAGFALMLLLPCAVTMLGTGTQHTRDSQDKEDRSAPAPLTALEPRARTRTAPKPPAAIPAAAAIKPESVAPPKVADPKVADPKVASLKVAGPGIADPGVAGLKVADPGVAYLAPPNRTPKTHQARILRSEIEALMAAAVAARAQAGALAANARLAAAKAEAADAAATIAEDAAAIAIQEMRRAA